MLVLAGETNFDGPSWQRDDDVDDDRFMQLHVWVKTWRLTS